MFNLFAINCSLEAGKTDANSNMCLSMWAHLMNLSMLIKTDNPVFYGPDAYSRNQLEDI